ncbi:MAG: hypothetical protein ABEJ60_00905 [Halodesulfurarchaeum sp.]
MPGYDEHVGAAKLIAALLAPVLTGLTYYLTADPRLAAIGLVGSTLVVLGGMAPDLDSNSSIPRRRLVRLVSGLLVFSIGGFLGRYWDRLVVTLEGVLTGRLSIVPPEGILLLLAGAAVALVVHKTGDAVQAVLPAHRGLFHELPFWVMVGGTIGAGLFAAGSLLDLPRSVTLYAAVVLPALLVLGVSVHLYQDDEIV